MTSPGGCGLTELEADVRALAAKHGLTRSEAAIVMAYLVGLSRDEVLAARGVSVNTYKTQVRSALRKLGLESLRDVREAALGQRIRALTVARLGNEEGSRPRTERHLALAPAPAPPKAASGDR